MLVYADPDQPAELSGDELARIAALSRDLPALWDAPATTSAERKEIVRLLAERVVVHVRKDSEYVDVEIHWRGGFTSRHEVIRPVQLHEHLPTTPGCSIGSPGSP